MLLSAPPAPPSAAALLAWYDRHRRSMPWRTAPGEVPDPYHVWLSEIMLQQTTVATVGPYFERFLTRFPTVHALAAAPLDDVLQAWAGLGYYARARNLHACAQRVAAADGFPRDVAGLRALPGVGAYTAAAIASIAFGAPAIPVDGNVERIAARLFAIERPLPAARAQIAAAARALGADPVAATRPADYTQALFDLGATICTPRAPACLHCPWQKACLANARGIAPDLPRKSPKKPRPLRHGAHFWLEDADARVLLQRRPAEGLLGGMLQLPGTPWREAAWPAAEALALAPHAAPWQLAGTARHGFTHFELELDIYWARVLRIDAPGQLHGIGTLASQALPTLMRRCVAAVQKSALPFTLR